MTSYIIPVPPLIPEDLEVSSFQVTRPKVIKGTVTQATSVTTGVTLNAASGVITMFSATTAAGASDSFVVTNSYVGSVSQILACVQDYSGTTGLPVVIVDNLNNSGTFTVTLQNVGNAALNGVVKVGFMVV